MRIVSEVREVRDHQVVQPIHDIIRWVWRPNVNKSRRSGLGCSRRRPGFAAVCWRCVSRHQAFILIVTVKEL